MHHIPCRQLAHKFFPYLFHRFAGLESFAERGQVGGYRGQPCVVFSLWNSCKYSTLWNISANLLQYWRMNNACIHIGAKLRTMLNMESHYLILLRITQSIHWRNITWCNHDTTHRTRCLYAPYRGKSYRATVSLYVNSTWCFCLPVCLPCVLFTCLHRRDSVPWEDWKTCPAKPIRKHSHESYTIRKACNFGPRFNDTLWAHLVLYYFTRYSEKYNEA